MKGLVIRQPFAGLIAKGLKTIEIRSWFTDYRGPIAIVAGKGAYLRTVSRYSPPIMSVRGVMLCVVELHDCRRLQPGDFSAACLKEREAADRGIRYGRHHAWLLRNATQCMWRPVTGAQGLFRLLPSDEQWAWQTIGQSARDVVKTTLADLL